MDVLALVAPNPSFVFSFLALLLGAVGFEFKGMG